jgi:quinoprotein glucose dehydrogenase
LDAKTGKRLWHFQTVHHDVWDMDISSPPILVTINKDGKKIEAVAQTTKTGMIFTFDRKTGEPVYPIEERSVPTADGVIGEEFSPTQPFPVKPAPFARHGLKEEELNRVVSEESYRDIRQRFRSYNSKGIYTPPSKNGSIVFPGYDGGGEWGGPSYDPETGILYVNANEMTWVLNLVELEKKSSGNKSNMEAGAILYKKNCMVCHGPERLGAGDYPGLIGVNKKIELPQFKQLLSTGRRMMPGFGHLSDAEKEALGSFILELKDKQAQPYQGAPTTLEMPGESDKRMYTGTGYNKFLTKEGYPAINPPWGTLNAINLNTGEYVWKIPLGEFEELKKKKVFQPQDVKIMVAVWLLLEVWFLSQPLLMESLGCSTKRNGKLLFETDLPASGVATPATYQVNGKQYVVIACGGSKWGGKRGDAVVAFALPANKTKK